MSFLAEIHTAPVESSGIVGRSSNKVYMGNLTMHPGPASINLAKSASSKRSNFWRFNSAATESIVRFVDGPNSALCSLSFPANLSQANAAGHHNAYQNNISDSYASVQPATMRSALSPSLGQSATASRVAPTRRACAARADTWLPPAAKLTLALWT